MPYVLSFGPCLFCGANRLFCPDYFTGIDYVGRIVCCCGSGWAAVPEVTVDAARNRAVRVRVIGEELRVDAPEVAVGATAAASGAGDWRASDVAVMEDY